MEKLATVHTGLYIYCTGRRKIFYARLSKT